MITLTLPAAFAIAQSIMFMCLSLLMIALTGYACFYIVADVVRTLDKWAGLEPLPKPKEEETPSNQDYQYYKSRLYEVECNNNYLSRLSQATED